LLNLQSIDMSPKTLWPFFHCGELQNSVHHKAYCNGCVSYLIQANLMEQLEDLDPVAAVENQFGPNELETQVYIVVVQVQMCKGQ
jgi:hypothetical protein